MKKFLFIITFLAAAVILLPGCLALLDPSLASSTDRQTTITPSGPQQGTYTFWPRVRASMNAIPIDDAYIDKIVVQGRTMLVYVTGTPRGISDRNARGHNTAAGFKCTITDIDRPQRTWQSVGVASHITDGVIVSFSNVTATKLAIQTEYWNGIVVFDDITLGEPDRILNIPAPQAGTYTMWPRTTASMNGIPINDAFIDKVTIRGNNMLITVSSAARGIGTGPRGHNTAAGFKCYLTDLDRPWRIWNNIGAASSPDGVIVSFENVTGSRFRLETEYWNGLVFFEEFTLRAPD